jgi:phage tail sheath protein FI
LIEIRRQVRDIANNILFEPNRDATLAKFSAAVTPRLQRIQALSGLDRFKVIIDSSTTSQQDIEQNTIRGKIFVQPTKSIEYVSLDFVVTNNLSQQ